MDKSNNNICGKAKAPANIYTLLSVENAESPSQDEGPRQFGYLRMISGAVNSPSSHRRLSRASRKDDRAETTSETDNISKRSNDEFPVLSFAVISLTCLIEHSILNLIDVSFKPTPRAESNKANVRLSQVRAPDTDTDEDGEAVVLESFFRWRRERGLANGKTLSHCQEPCQAADSISDREPSPRVQTIILDALRDFVVSTLEPGIYAIDLPKGATGAQSLHFTPNINSAGRDEGAMTTMASGRGFPTNNDTTTPRMGTSTASTAQKASNAAKTFQPSWRVRGQRPPFNENPARRTREAGVRFQPNYKSNLTEAHIYNASETERNNCAVRDEYIEPGALLEDIFAVIRTGGSIPV